MSERTAAISGLNYTMPGINTAVLELARSTARLQEQFRLVDLTWAKQAQMIQASLSPFSAYHNAMAIQMQEFSAISAAIAEPVKRMHLQMAAFAAINRQEINRISASFSAIHTEWAKSSVILMSTYRPVLSALSHFDNEMASVLKAFSTVKLAMPSKLDVTALQNFSKSFVSMGYDTDDVELNDDGTMSIGGETMSSATVKEALLTSLRDSGILDSIKRIDKKVARLEEAHYKQNGMILAIEEAVNNLVHLVSSMKESKVKAVLQALVLALIVNFISNKLCHSDYATLY